MSKIPLIKESEFIAPSPASGTKVILKGSPRDAEKIGIPRELFRELKRKQYKGHIKGNAEIDNDVIICVSFFIGSTEFPFYFFSGQAKRFLSYVK